jgi:hypothetical protein
MGTPERVFAISESPVQRPDFVSNITEAKAGGRITWECAKYRRAARAQIWPVGLLVWDTGHGPEVVKDFAAWQGKITDGGVFAVHGNRTAWPMLVDYAVAGGMWVRGMVYKEAQIGTLRKIGD